MPYYALIDYDGGHFGYKIMAEETVQDIFFNAAYVLDEKTAKKLETNGSFIIKNNKGEIDDICEVWVVKNLSRARDFLYLMSEDEPFVPGVEYDYL